MKPASQIIEQSGLSYFGAMTASVSHEIKNCLAIVNENAGLLGDLLALSRQQSSLDTSRMDNILVRISGQIQRADTVIKRLNAFSHSMDKPVQSVNLGEAVQLAADLGARICANRRITIQTQQPEKAPHTTAPMFFVLYLIWTLVDGATSEMPSGATLFVTPVEKQGRPGISFSSTAPLGSGMEKAVVSGTGQNLLALVSAEVDIDPKSLHAELFFPAMNPATV